jgi:hypothetical protein
MGKVLAAVLFLCLGVSVFGQTQVAPVTQAEYVKMLYALQKDGSEKAAIIEALRTRGIDFVLTDGIRGVTRSKSGND